MRGARVSVIACSKCGADMNAARIVPAPKGRSRKFATSSAGEAVDSSPTLTVDTEIEGDTSLADDASFASTGNADSQSIDTTSDDLTDPLSKEITDESIARFNSEIKRIDKIISMWGEAKYIRFDNAHHGALAELETVPETTERSDGVKREDIVRRNDSITEKRDAAESDGADQQNFALSSATASKRSASEGAEQPIDFVALPETQFKSTLLATCMTFGGLLAMVLGGAHAISLSGPTLSYDVRIAVGFVCAGALGIIFGLWHEVGRMRRTLKTLVNAHTKPSS